MNSQFGKLNLYDIGKTFIMIILTTVLTTVATSLNAGSLPGWIEVKTSLLVGLAAGLSYLLKQFVTNSDGQVLEKEQPKV